MKTHRKSHGHVDVELAPDRSQRRRLDATRRRPGHLGGLALCASLAACGGREASGARGGDAAIREDASPTEDASAGACAASNRGACAYQPARTYPPAPTPQAMASLEYMDVTGRRRTFQVAVRVPNGPPRPWPVVVWSHGGLDGVRSATNVGVEWSETFTRAGYAFVGIAHAPRDAMTELEPICRHYGITTQEACVRFKYLHHDRAYDVRRTLDWLTEQQASGPYAGSIDLQRILLAGHSAGAGGASMVAGASRDFNGMTRTAPDPRPRAFIGFSIEGPMDDGFTDASFATITRPHMSVTGVGDVTSESDPAQRRRAFELMAPGNKFRFWLTSPAAQHSTFNHITGPCEAHQMRAGGSATICPEIFRWMESAALAFADAYLRDRPEAIAWLASNNASTHSNGIVEWSRR